MFEGLPPIERVPLVVASAITFALVIGCLLFCGAAAARHAAKKEAELGERPESTSDAIVWYVLSFMFWPAAFVLGIHFLGEGRTARVGRNCVYAGLGVIGVVTFLTCAAAIAVALAYGV